LARIPRWQINAFYIALAGSIVALVLSAPWNYLGTAGPEAGAGPFGKELFTGMLIFDGLTVYFRAVLMLFAVCFIVMTKLSGIPDSEDGADFYTLVLGGLLGMCIMASANHLLTVFLGVEMASVPSYALAGMLKGRRKSSEAALKYAVYGAGAAGVMLYGISLLAGAIGSVHLPTMIQQLGDMPNAVFAERQSVMMLGGLMMAVGLAFKLSAVPFHFWAPDVFEGASAEVGAFLSVASKAAGLALLLRIAIGFGSVAAPGSGPVSPPVTAQAAIETNGPQAALVSHKPGAEASQAKVTLVSDEDSAATPAEIDIPKQVRDYIIGLVGLIAAVTCTFGNLAAYAQTNIKRLLAYSTIAHAGYMMMPVAAIVVLMGSKDAPAQDGVAALAFYVGAYLFMNLGAFAIVAFMRNVMRSEEIADYAGLIRRSPGLVICFSMILISLIGLPFFSGFFAKMLAFYILVPAKLYWLLVVGGLNTALSLFYYLRIIKAMTMEPEPADRLPVDFSMISPQGVFVALVTIPVVVMGVFPDAFLVFAKAAAATTNML